MVRHVSQKSKDDSRGTLPWQFEGVPYGRGLLGQVPINVRSPTISQMRCWGNVDTEESPYGGNRFSVGYRGLLAVSTPKYPC
jgi:hypothetical protein